MKDSFLYFDPRSGTTVEYGDSQLEHALGHIGLQVEAVLGENDER